MEHSKKNPMIPSSYALFFLMLILTVASSHDSLLTNVVSPGQRMRWDDSVSHKFGTHLLLPLSIYFRVLRMELWWCTNKKTSQNRHVWIVEYNCDLEQKKDYYYWRSNQDGGHRAAKISKKSSSCNRNTIRPISSYIHFWKTCRIIIIMDTTNMAHLLSD